MARHHEFLRAFPTNCELLVTLDLGNVGAVQLFRADSDEGVFHLWKHTHGWMRFTRSMCRIRGDFVKVQWQPRITMFGHQLSS